MADKQKILDIAQSYIPLTKAIGLIAAVVVVVLNFSGLSTQVALLANKLDSNIVAVNRLVDKMDTTIEVRIRDLEIRASVLEHSLEIH